MRFALPVQIRNFSLLRQNKLVKVAELAPFGDYEISLFINRSSVRRIADAFLPLVSLQSEIGSLLFIRIVTYLRNDVTLLIQDSNPPLQFWEDGVLAADMHCRGHS